MMKEFRTSRNLVFLAIIGIITLSAGLIRVLPLYDAVITEDGIRFQGVDAFYHARLTAYVTRNYPHRMEHDDLRLHPSGQHVDVYPAFDVVNATAALLAGFGDPSDRTIDVVAAWTPPVLGALTTLVMGIAGWALAGPWGGLVSATIAGFLPGGTLNQTIIGLTDHHALEAFLLSLSWLLLILLVRRDSSGRLRMIATLSLGIAIGTYVLTWEGGPLLPTSYALFVALRSALSTTHEGQRTLVRESFVVAGVTAALVLTWSFFSTMVWVSLGLLFLTPLIPLSRIMLDAALRERRKRIRLVLWCASLVLMAIGAYLAFPEPLRRALDTNIGRLVPSKAAQTVAEMRPMYHDPMIVKIFFGYPLLWVLPGLALGIVAAIRKQDPRSLLPVLLGPLFITLALLQTRFSTSASLMIALLNALALTESFELVQRRMAGRIMPRRVIAGVIAATWVVSAGFWSVDRAFATVTVDQGPSIAWMEAMAWLRRNAPSPLVPSQSGGADSAGPSAPSHGVLNWWDSGYYLVHMAGQRPVSNPTQSGATWAAKLFLDTAVTSWTSELLRHNIRYVVADARLAFYPRAVDQTTSHFPALLVWAGREQKEYVRTVYFRNPDGSLEGRFVYLPAYFQSTLLRLLLYEGKVFEPPSGTAWVIQVRTQSAPDGSKIDIMESGQAFRSYEDAARFLHDRRDPSWILVSFSPFASPIKLEALPGVEHIFSSSTFAAQPPGNPRPIPSVSIFSVGPANVAPDSLP